MKLNEKYTQRELYSPTNSSTKQHNTTNNLTIHPNVKLFITHKLTLSLWSEHGKLSRQCQRGPLAEEFCINCLLSFSVNEFRNFDIMS